MFSPFLVSSFSLFFFLLLAFLQPVSASSYAKYPPSPPRKLLDEPAALAALRRLTLWVGAGLKGRTNTGEIGERQVRRGELETENGVKQTGKGRKRAEGTRLIGKEKKPLGQSL